MKGMNIGLKEALSLTIRAIKPLPAEDVSLVDSIDRTAALDLNALVDSPSLDASSKDGYAVLSHDVAHATVEKPVRLRLLGSIEAGCESNIQIKPGTTARILTGARIPTGADAVVAEEFVKQGDKDIFVEIFAEPGRNILPHGKDVSLNKCILRSGQQISPGMAGFIAAAGHSMVPVFRNPVVGIIGTGDEIVEPGKPLSEGKLYASNIVTLAGWCSKYKMKTRMRIVRDDYDAILKELKMLSEGTDAIITSGGAWTGDRDMVAQVLEGLGWKEMFHRIRIGPGKAVGFGILDEKPVFILPGGPTSNLMGFLQIALPGLLALSGHSSPGLQRINARLGSDLRGRELDWTNFFFGILEYEKGLPTFFPIKKRSRLSSIADAKAVAAIPEGEEYISKGSIISVQLLS